MSRKATCNIASSLLRDMPERVKQFFDIRLDEARMIVIGAQFFNARRIRANGLSAPALCFRDIACNRNKSCRRK